MRALFSPEVEVLGFSVIGRLPGSTAPIFQISDSGQVEALRNASMIFQGLCLRTYHEIKSNPLTQ